MTTEFNVFFKGAGSPVESKNEFQTSLIVSDGKEKLFINCGTDFIRSAALSIPLSAVDYLYVGHLSFDHIGGIAGVILAKLYSPNSRRLTIYTVPEFQEKLVEIISTQVFAGLDVVNPGRFFTVVSIDPEKDEIFKVGSMTCKPTPLPKHGKNKFFYGHGLLIEADMEIGKKTIFFSGKCPYDLPFLMPIYERSDLIVQYCSSGGEIYPIYARETKGLEIMRLAREVPTKIKKKMVLCYHKKNETTGEQIKAFDFKGEASSGSVYGF